MLFPENDRITTRNLCSSAQMVKIAFCIFRAVNNQILYKAPGNVLNFYWYPSVNFNQNKLKIQIKNFAPKTEKKLALFSISYKKIFFKMLFFAISVDFTTNQMVLTDYCCLICRLV